MGGTYHQEAAYTRWVVEDGHTWEAPDGGRRRVPLPVVGLVALLAVVVVASLVGGGGHDSPLRVSDGDPDAETEDADAGGWPQALVPASEARGEWTSVPGPSPHMFGPATTAWTGREVLVVGSASEGQHTVALDPIARTWREAAPGPLAPRRGAAAVWMPDEGAAVHGEGELLVWGGYGTVDERWLDDAARYDPVLDRWTDVADSPLAPATGAFGVRSGSQVLVGGGRAERRHQGRVARYDPSADAWVELPAPFRDDVRIAGLVAAGSTAVAVSAQGEVAQLRRDGVWRALPAVPEHGGKLAAVAAVGVHVAVWEVAADPEVPGRLHLLDVAAARWAEAPPAPIGKSTVPLLVPLSDVDVAVLGAAPADSPGEGPVTVAVYSHRGTDRWQTLPATTPGMRGDAVVGAVWTGHDLVVIGPGTAFSWRFAGLTPPLEEHTAALVHLLSDDQLVTVDVDARRSTSRPHLGRTGQLDAVDDWLLLGGDEPGIVSSTGGAYSDLGADQTVLPAGQAGAWIAPADATGVRFVPVVEQEVGEPEVLPHAVPDGWRPVFGLEHALVLVDEDEGWMLWDPRTGRVLREGRGDTPVAAGERKVALCLGQGTPARCPLLLLVDEDPEGDRPVRRGREQPAAGSVFGPGDRRLAMPYADGGLSRGLEIVDLAGDSMVRVPLPPSHGTFAWHPDGSTVFAVQAGGGARLLAIRLGAGDPGPYIVPVDIPQRVVDLAVTWNPRSR